MTQGHIRIEEELSDEIIERMRRAIEDLAVAHRRTDASFILGHICRFCRAFVQPGQVRDCGECGITGCSWCVGNACPPCQTNSDVIGHYHGRTVD